MNAAAIGGEVILIEEADDGVTALQVLKTAADNQNGLLVEVFDEQDDHGQKMEDEESGRKKER